MNRLCEVEKITTFSRRRCPASYGVVYREKFDKRRHQRQECKKYGLDGIKYAEKQIHWLIRTRQKTPKSQNIEYMLYQTFDCDDPITTWTVEIIKCSVEPEQLPTSMLQRDKEGQKLDKFRLECSLPTGLLETAGMKLKKRHWYKPTSKYWVVKYLVRLTIGPGNLLLFNAYFNDQKLNESAPLQVQQDFFDDNELYGLDLGSNQNL